MSTTAELDAARRTVIDLLRDGDRFVTVTHEHPDGDAIGSLVAATRALQSLGKDVVAVVAPGDLPLSREYADLVTVDLVCAAPPDLDERIALFLDCGNIDRMAVPDLYDGSGRPERIVNVDHHHDNTCFGDVNLVDATASSTVEILWGLFRELDVELDRETAEALYVGLVTDTGRFMYQNTSRVSHLMAADLVAAGVDPFPVYRTLYEGVPWSKLALLGRALERVRIEEDVRLTFALLRRRDFAETQAENSESEGIIDHLRTVTGTQVAVLAREIQDDEAAPAGIRNGDGPGTAVRTKVSLRSAGDGVDVSAVARAGGGGGHPHAAGFTTTMDEEDLLAFLRVQLRPHG